MCVLVILVSRFFPASESRPNHARYHTSEEGAESIEKAPPSTSAEGAESVGEVAISTSAEGADSVEVLVFYGCLLTDGSWS